MVVQVVEVHVQMQQVVRVLKPMDMGMMVVMVVIVIKVLVGVVPGL
jgi:hypothetical protein